MFGRENSRFAAAAVALTIGFASLPVQAEEQRPQGEHHEHHEHHGPYERHEFHGRDVGRFERHDMEMWRAGRWHQTWHDGRFGWWWFAGGVWYFYERPVYPYPMIVSETVFVEPAPVVVVPPAPVVAAPPPAVVVAPPAPVVVAPPPPPPPGPAPQQFWYYCDNPPGYYPYVANCNTPFRQVPVTPR